MTLPPGGDLAGGVVFWRVGWSCGASRGGKWAGRREVRAPALRAWTRVGARARCRPARPRRSGRALPKGGGGGSTGRTSSISTHSIPGRPRAGPARRIGGQRAPGARGPPRLTMEGGSFGAGRAGAALDPVSFARRPQTLLRVASWVSGRPQPPPRYPLPPRLVSRIPNTCASPLPFAPSPSTPALPPRPQVRVTSPGWVRPPAGGGGAGGDSRGP